MHGRRTHCCAVTAVTVNRGAPGRSHVPCHDKLLVERAWRLFGMRASCADLGDTLAPFVIMRISGDLVALIHHAHSARAAPARP